MADSTMGAFIVWISGSGNPFSVHVTDMTVEELAQMVETMEGYYIWLSHQGAHRVVRPMDSCPSQLTAKE